MSSLTWAEARQQAQPMSQARLRAEMEWAAITGKAPSILRTIDDVPAVRPPPAVPRGRGKRHQKPKRPVLVEVKRSRMVECPDGRVLACKRTTQSHIAA
jgi:hypothetical protein